MSAPTRCLTPSIALFVAAFTIGCVIPVSVGQGDDAQSNSSGTSNDTEEREVPPDPASSTGPDATSTPSITGDTTQGSVDTGETTAASETTAVSETTAASGTSETSETSGTTAANETTAASGTSETSGTSGTSETTDTGSTPQCPESPAFECSAPVDCSSGGCGGPFADFDADGCMRPKCSPWEECDPGFTCLFSIDYGGCESSEMYCYDDRTGACLCLVTDDCNGGHCLPEAEAPPLECFGLPDEMSCLDANCGHFETVTEISDDCECTPGVPACVLFLGSAGGLDAPDYFWHEATGTVALFGTSWDWPPVGWRPCTDPGAPPACGCYEPFMAPECP